MWLCSTAPSLFAERLLDVLCLLLHNAMGLSLGKNINEHEEIRVSTLAQLQLCVILGAVYKLLELYVLLMLGLSVIGERERANLVVRSGGIFCIIIVVRTSCKCACAALYALLFIRNYFQMFYAFSHTVPRDMRRSI